MNFDRMWTPWRADYVTRDPAEQGVSCFLCASPASGADEEALILVRGVRTFMLLNRYPYNSGHLMVAPYEHGGEIASLSGDTATEMWDLAQQAIRGLAAAYRPQGFNIGMNVGESAGAGVPDHLHLHVVPRWAGDTNYMPVIAETKVLPETLQQTYARLRAVLAES